MTSQAPAAAVVRSIIVNICGADDDYLDLCAFDRHWPCDEFRFMGALGFGGKVHWAQGRCWVSCYREHETDWRRTAIAAANDCLAAQTTGLVSS